MVPGPHRVTLIPGDGSGPELVGAALAVIEAAGVGVDWDVQQVGEGAVVGGGDPLPASVLESLAETRVGLKGPVTTRPGRQGLPSVNVALRRSLDLFAQVRPCRHLLGAPAVHTGVDLVVMRETTEDLYSGIEFPAREPETRRLLQMVADTGRPPPHPDAAVSLKPISEQASRRFLELAFAHAGHLGRHRVTAVHKATAMRCTDGLFLEVAREVATGHPDIEFDDCLVDSLCARLVRSPHHYDVLVTTTLYGDILSDLAAALVGGIGLAPGVNFGDGMAVFEAAHGSAPSHVGQDRLNPMALILTGAMLLRHLGEVEAANRVEAAVASVVAEGRTLTYDLCGPTALAAGTAAVTRAIIQRL